MKQRKTDFFEIADMLLDGWEIRQSRSTGAVWLTHPAKLFRPNMSIDVFDRMLEEGNIKKNWTVSDVEEYRLTDKGQAFLEQELLNHQDKFYAEQENKRVHPNKRELLRRG